MNREEILNLNKEELIAKLNELENNYIAEVSPLLETLGPHLQKVYDIEKLLSDIRCKYKKDISDILNITLDDNKKYLLNKVFDREEFNLKKLMSNLPKNDMMESIKGMTTNEIEAYLRSLTLLSYNGDHYDDKLVDTINQHWEYFEDEDSLKLYLNISDGGYRDLSYLPSGKYIYMLYIDEDNYWRYKEVRWDDGTKKLYDGDRSPVNFAKLNIVDYKFFNSIKSITLYLANIKGYRRCSYFNVYFYDDKYKPKKLPTDLNRELH